MALSQERLQEIVARTHPGAKVIVHEVAPIGAAEDAAAAAVADFDSASLLALRQKFVANGAAFAADADADAGGAGEVAATPNDDEAAEFDDDRDQLVEIGFDDTEDTKVLLIDERSGEVIAEQG